MDKPIAPMGHDFDNEEMLCECGVTWFSQRENPDVCALVKPSEPVPDSHLLTLDDLRRAIGLPLRVVAGACGISTTSAFRAVSGRVGGKGQTSKATSDRVGKFLRDCAGDW